MHPTPRKHGSQGASLRSSLNAARAGRVMPGVMLVDLAHGGNMQKLQSLLFTILISISIIALAHESMAQTSAAPSKAGTRLITLGTSSGPNREPTERNRPIC